jgi:hypothetical protein
VALFGFPALSRRSSAPEVALASDRSGRRTFAIALGAIVATAAVAALPAVRSYTAMHHRPGGGAVKGR